MGGQPWLKLYASETLLSESLAQLTAEEERTWWRLLCNASLSDERFSAQITPALAKKCLSTPKKFPVALRRMAELGMISLELSENGEPIAYAIVNAERYQGRASDSNEASRERQRRHRAQDGHAMSRVTGRDMSRGRHAVEEEKEEERDRDQEREEEGRGEQITPRDAAPPRPRDSQIPMPRMVASVRRSELPAAEPTPEDVALWNRARERLRAELTGSSFGSMVEPLEVAGRTEAGELLLRAPTEALRRQVASRLGLSLARALANESVGTAPAVRVAS